MWQTTEDFEPLQYYKNVLESKFQKNAKEYFDVLVKKSKVSASANQKTVARYKRQLKHVEEAKNNCFWNKALRLFVILLSVAALFGSIAMAYLSSEEGGWVYPVCLALLLVLSVVLFVLTVTKIKTRIERAEDRYRAAEKKADAFQKEAYAQMRPLHELFSSRMTHELIEKTYPDIRFDACLSSDKFVLMSEKYGMPENGDMNSATIGVLSGDLDRNPFVYVRNRVRSFKNETYKGYINISWVTYASDAKGGTRAVRHSQTLVARYVAPKPVYSCDTKLYYGNEAAPDLCFSRQAGYVHRLSESEIESKVEEKQREIRKKMRKAVSAEEGHFTEMGNAEFDGLFSALDRDNEVQFRLMFTPLAQKNMLALLRSDAGYGDDFSFVKQGMLNTIRSDHAQKWAFFADPSRLMHYDFSVVRSEFLSFQSEYFRSLYFDMAPLLAVPLYQMQQPEPFPVEKRSERNYSSCETEALINGLSLAALTHPNTQTKVIFKTKFLQKDGRADKVLVTAHSFQKEVRVAYIPKMGGDKRLHAVPVQWTEYIPLQQQTVVEIKRVGGTREECMHKCSDRELTAHLRKYTDSVNFHDGFLVMILTHGYFDEQSDAEFERLYGAVRTGLDLKIRRAFDAAQAFQKAEAALLELEAEEQEALAEEETEKENEFSEEEAEKEEEIERTNVDGQE